jgi:hypothetical protein
MRFTKIIFSILVTVVALLTFTTGAFAGTWVNMGNVPGKITIAPDGTIWSAGGSATLGRVKYWNGSGWQDITAPTLYDGLYDDESITDIAVRSDGTLFVTTKTGAADSGKVFKYINNNWIEDKPASDTFYSIFADHNNNIWVYGYEYPGKYHIYKLSGSSWTLELNGSSSFTSKFTVSDDRVLTAGNTYVYQRLYSSSTWAITGGNSSSRIYAVLKTIDGKIIIGCDNGHVYYWNGYSWADMGTTAPDGSIVYSLANAPDGSILAGTNNGFVSRYNGATWDVLGQVCGYNKIEQILIGTNGDIIVRGSNNQVMKYTSDLLSLVPNPDGPTGHLVIDSRYLGFAPVRLNLQQSTDGVNFSDCFTVTNGSKYIFSPTQTSYYFRFKWYWPYITSGHRTNYSNVVGPIPAIVSTPNLSISSGLKTWDAQRGRSYASLNWSAVTNATGYKLHVFDGNTYRTKDLGNVITWDSQTAKIFPLPSELTENNSVSSDIFHWNASGLDFEDTALRLYRSTVGTGYDSDPKFYFRITAYNQWMETNFNATSSFKTVTMPTATDTAIPTGSATVTSQEGLEKTFSRDVTVNVNAQDTGSGIWKIELSNDGTTYNTVKTFNKNADNSTGISSNSESFPWTLSPGAGTKTVYVRITDSVGNQRTVTGSIALAEDMLPPSVNLLINGGASSTTTSSVTLTINVSDNASVSSQMQMGFSNDGNLWSPWEPYQQTKSWDITNPGYGGTTGAGVKKVYVRVYDQAQNIGLASAEIAYNPNPPTTSGVTFTGGVSGTYNGQPVVFVKGDMPTLNVTASGAAQVRYDNGIGFWSDWESYSSSKQIVLAKSSGVCRVKIQVADINGVTSNPVEMLVVVDSKAPAITKISGQNGATATSSSTFYVVVQATDDMPGQLQACTSVDGETFGNWYNVPQSVIPVTLSTTGAHTITVKVRDLAGNETQASMTAFRL